MKLLRESEGASSFRMKPIDKRVLITKIVGNTHERLARSGIFKNAFLRTGTWLPTDGSADAEFCLQGVDLKYTDVITVEKVEAHRKKCEEQAAKEDAEKKAAVKAMEEKKNAIAEQLAPALEQSKIVWPRP